jgi:hypothetical protein
LKSIPWLSRNDLSPKLLLGFFVLALFLSLESWIFGPYSDIPMHDVGNGQVPAFYRLAQSFYEYGYHYWYPYHLTGNDQSATYSLLHLITPFYIFLPIWLAFSSVLVLQHFFGAIAMYLFCRKKFNLPKVSACIAAIAYTSPFLVMFGAEAHQQWWMNNYFEYRLAWGFVIPLLPLFLLGIDRATTQEKLSNSILWAIFIGVALVLTMFFIAFWPYILLMFAIYSFTLGGGSFLKKVLVLVVITVVSGLLQIDHLVAATDIYPESHRQIMDLFAGRPLKLQPFNYELIDYFQTYLEYKPQVIIPYFYRMIFIWFPIPFICVFLILIPVLFLPIKDSVDKKIISRVLISLLIFGLIHANAQLIRIVLFQVSEKFARLNIDYLWGIGIKFYAVVIFAFAINTILIWLKKYRIAQVVVIVLALCPIIYATGEYRWKGFIGWIYNGSAYANYSSPQIAALKCDKPCSPFRVASITGGGPPSIFYPNFVNAYGLESFDAYENIFPQRFGRYFLETIAPNRDAYNAAYIGNFIDKKSYELNVVSSFAFIFGAGDHLSQLVNINLLSLANVKYIISPRALNDASLRLVSSPADTIDQEFPWVAKAFRKVISPLKKISRFFGDDFNYHINLADQTLATNFHGKKMYIYENTQVLPRAFIVYKTQVQDQQNVWSALARAGLNELQTTAYIESKESSLSIDNTLPKKHEIESIEWQVYAPNHLKMKGIAAATGIVVLSNSYSKHWKVHVNGVETKTIIVDGAFTGIPVKEGLFEVEMRYLPPFGWGS